MKLLFVLTGSLLSANAFAHVGKLDAAGCHTSPKTEIYHCHVTPKSAQPAGGPSGMPAGFDNCDDARLAGAAPLKRGQPGYGAHLDRDGDGVACD